MQTEVAAMLPEGLIIFALALILWTRSCFQGEPPPPDRSPEEELVDAFLKVLEKRREGPK
jgi:hypothetical protein